MSDVVRNLDSSRKPITRAARAAGPYPYYGANGVQDRVAGYLFDGEFLLVGEDGSVVNRDHSPVVNWASGQIWVNNHAHVLQARTGALNLRFLHFYLQTIDVRPYVTGGTQRKLNQSNLNRIPVPLPVRADQDRIVSVLDKLDERRGDLSSALLGEIAARTLQYEFYRDKLVSFEAAA